MDASVRILALDGYSGRLARISASYAISVAACIGMMGAAVVLLTDAIVWSPIVLSLAFGGFMLTYVRMQNRLRHFVLDSIIDLSTVRNGFVSMSLSYLGYSTRRVSDCAFIADGEILVYVKKSFGMNGTRESLTENDIRDAMDIASENRMKSILAVEMWFGTHRVLPKTRELMRRHGVMLLDLNCLFGATHAKTMADAKRT